MQENNTILLSTDNTSSMAAALPEANPRLTRLAGSILSFLMEWTK
jgi:hypothetical protein